jgi:GDP-L-fucose synthase
MPLSSVLVIGTRPSVGMMVHRALEGSPGQRGEIRVRAAWIDPKAGFDRAFAESFRAARPDAVILAGARSAGIGENLRVPFELMIENLLFAAHGIQAAEAAGVEKLIFLGSSCAYPVSAPVPIRESELLGSPPEASSESYAIAKLAGMKLCEAVRKQTSRQYFAVVPATPYGPGDDFGTGHVVPALLARFHEAKKAGAPEVAVWGSGAPERDFIFADDLAAALLLLLGSYSGPGPINVGPGTGVSIRCLAELVGEVVGYRGAIRFDSSKPDGAPKKFLDASRISELGWSAKTSLQDGLERTYAWALKEGVL